MSRKAIFLWLRRTWDQNPFVAPGIVSVPLFPAIYYAMHGEGFWLSEFSLGIMAFSLWWLGIGLSAFMAIRLYDRAKKGYRARGASVWPFSETWQGKAWAAGAVVAFLLLSCLADFCLKSIDPLGQPIRYIQALSEDAKPYDY